MIKLITIRMCMGSFINDVWQKIGFFLVGRHLWTALRVVRKLRHVLRKGVFEDSMTSQDISFYGIFVTRGVQKKTIFCVTQFMNDHVSVLAIMWISNFVKEEELKKIKEHKHLLSVLKGKAAVIDSKANRASEKEIFIKFLGKCGS